MNWHLYYSLPAAVYVAVGIFLIKEGLEWRRRRRTDGRKLAVYKSVIAYECERNHYFIKTLKQMAGYASEGGTVYDIENDPSGRQHYRFITPDGESTSGGIIPNIRRETLERMALEVGNVNEELAAKTRIGLYAALELQHLRDSLITYSVQVRDAPPPKEMQESFFLYAVSEADRCYKSLSELYYACTGKILSDHKMR